MTPDTFVQGERASRGAHSADRPDDLLRGQLLARCAYRRARARSRATAAGARILRPSVLLAPHSLVSTLCVCCSSMGIPTRGSLRVTLRKVLACLLESTLWFRAELVGGCLRTQGPNFQAMPWQYPLAQEPATLWYHDHTQGITR